MAERDAAESFWRFSLLVYGRPGVADALLALQDTRGHNVNLMLFALWLGLCEGVRLDTAGLARARAAIEKLDGDAVQPLRRLRRALKDDPDADLRALRRRVLALEIDAERRVQARLAASAGRRKARPGDRQARAEANLRLVMGADADSDAAVRLWGVVGVS